MTVLQVLNSLFYLLIYPFLIRTLGAESYGLYVFAMSVVTYFTALVSFGFDMPALKSIVENHDNSNKKEYTLSCIFTAKVYLEIISSIIFALLVFSIPFFKTNWFILVICFANTLTNILFPNWFFQGIQKMRVVTIIQLSLKLLSLPFIFLIVKGVNDVWKFAAITTLANVGGGFVAAYIIYSYDKLKIKLIPFSEIKIWFKEALPFFWSNAMNTVKQQTVSVLIGSFFSMSDVAVYDLAIKIFMVPTTLISSVNGALFPKIMLRYDSKLIKRVINLENLLGVLVIVALALFGKFLIVFMAGEAMLGAYPLLIILSLSIFVSLTVGAISNFIFVPLNYYFVIFRNQFLASLIFLVVAFGGIYLGAGIIILPLSITISGFVEIVYCTYIVHKQKLYSQIQNGITKE